MLELGEERLRGVVDLFAKRGHTLVDLLSAGTRELAGYVRELTKKNFSRDNNPAPN